MRFFEYESRAIVAKAGIPVTKHGFATSSEQARRIAQDIGGPVVIKSQVLTGGRMKAGGVQFADTPGQAAELTEQVLGLEIGGHMPRGVLVDSRAAVRHDDGSISGAASDYATLYRSTDGGKTWGAEVYDVAINNGSARPGMAVVSRMGNGQYVMSFEACNTTPDCGAHIKISSDGDNWGNASDLGPLVQTSDGRYLTSTPYNTWAPTGGSKGAIYVAAKVEYNSNGSIASGSGSTLLANTNLGSGPWHAVPAPLSFQTIVPNCNGWSQPLVAAGTTLMQMAAVAIAGTTSRCEIRFGSVPMSNT